MGQGRSLADPCAVKVSDWLFFGFFFPKMGFDGVFNVEGYLGVF